jgi:hypothetical protein
MFRKACLREFGLQGSVHSSVLGSYRRVGSALPPGFDFQVSKTLFSFGSSTLAAFFFWFSFKSRFAARLSMSLSRVGSATPPKFGFQVSKTSFSLDSSALFAFFFWLGFMAQDFCRTPRCCFVSLLKKVRCSRLYEQPVEIQCFAKSILLEGVESLHLLHDQSESIWLLRKVESLVRKVGCSRLFEQLARNRCFTSPNLVVAFESWHICSEQEARKSVIALSLSSLL